MSTNIKKLQHVATTLLHCSLNIDEQFPFIAHHPLFPQTVYALQKNGSMQLLNLANDDELELAKQDTIKRINKATNAADFLILINKPYLPAFFKFANKYMSPEDFSMFLAEMWTYVEFPNKDANISPLQFVKLFQQANMRYMMSKEDMETYENLPETVKIYRGINEGGCVKALSWTTNVETAEWFATRWSNSDGSVMVAEIDKADILAYFGGRGEFETVVDYRKLKNIEKYC